MGVIYELNLPQKTPNFDPILSLKRKDVSAPISPEKVVEMPNSGKITINLYIWYK